MAVADNPILVLSYFLVRLVFFSHTPFYFLWTAFLFLFLFVNLFLFFTFVHISTKQDNVHKTVMWDSRCDSKKLLTRQEIWKNSYFTGTFPKPNSWSMPSVRPFSDTLDHDNFDRLPPDRRAGRWLYSNLQEYTNLHPHPLNWTQFTLPPPKKNSLHYE